MLIKLKFSLYNRFQKVIYGLYWLVVVWKVWVFGREMTAHLVMSDEIYIQAALASRFLQFSH